MGKVRIKFVKRLARELLEKYPDRFSTDFEHNKKVVGELIGSYSKKMQNLVVGYICRLKRRMQMGEEAVT